jgi:pyridoxine/pyridoxamine 5'-phosphate oxidase
MTNRDQVKTVLQTLVFSMVWVAMAWGCAVKPIPPSEPTVAMLQRAYQEMREQVASGQVSPIEARDQYYKKLAEVEPPLTGLDTLLDYRRQVRAELIAEQLSREQADSRLKERESELLTHWAETAAEYAAEQCRLEKIQRDYERDFRQQRQIEEGSGIKNLPRQ